MESKLYFVGGMIKYVEVLNNEWPVIARPKNGREPGKWGTLYSNAEWLERSY